MKQYGSSTGIQAIVAHKTIQKTSYATKTTFVVLVNLTVNQTWLLKQENIFRWLDIEL